MGIASTAGYPIQNPIQWTFRTGAIDKTPPQVISYTPPNGAVSVPTLSDVWFLLSEQPSQASLSGSTILISPRGQAPVAISSVAVVQVQGGVRVQPALQQPLLANQIYDVRLEGIRDIAGNALAPFSWSFTTGAATSGPQLQVISMTPPAGSSGLGLQPTIAVLLNAAVRPTNLYTQGFVVVGDPSKRIAAISSLGPGGGLLTLFPVQPLSPLTTYELDLTGLVSLGGSPISIPSPNPYRFQTGAGATDDVPPRLLSALPPDGATGVANGNPIVLTFSEAIDPATFTPETVSIYFDHDGPASFLGSLSRSADNRTFAILGHGGDENTHSRRVTIFVTGGVRDLAGNSLGETVQIAYDTRDGTQISGGNARPELVEVRPRDGFADAEPAQPVTFFFSEPVETAGLESKLFLAREGVVVPATAAIGGLGDYAAIHPAQPHPAGAFIQGFALGTIADPEGLPLFNGLQTTAFQVAPDDAASAPLPVSVSPQCCSTPAPTDARFAVLFTEPLAAGSVSSGSVAASYSGGAIPLTISLTGGGRRIQAVPQSGAWPSNALVTVALSVAIQDLQGTPMPNAASFQFQTGAGPGASDAFSVVRSSTLPGIPMPVNAHLFVRFSRTVDATTVLEPNVRLTRNGLRVPLLGFELMNEDKVVSIVPSETLAAGATYQLHVEGVADVSGRTSGLFTAAFQAGAGVDGSAPVLANLVRSGYPINSALSLTFNEPISPVTAHLDQVWALLDSTSPATRIPGSISQSSDGRTVTFTPDGLLPANSPIRVVYSGLRDLAGNAPRGGAFSGSVQFSTSAVSDSNPPELTELFPSNGLSGAPLNAVVRFRFNEEVTQAFAMQPHAELRSSTGALVDATVELFPPQSYRYTLRPKRLLNPNETYTFHLSGVTDLAGNAIAPVVSSFTTGPLPALGRFVSALFPAHNSTVPYVDVEPYLIHTTLIDPATVSSQSAYIVRDDQTQAVVPGAVTLSENNTRLTIHPHAPLAEGRYRVHLSGVLDAAGRPLSLPGAQWIFTALDLADDTVPPTVLSVTPPNGFTAVPGNASITAYFSEMLDPQSGVAAQQKVETAGGAPVSFAIQVMPPEPATGKPAHLKVTPTGPLPSSTAITVTLQGLRDLAGNTMTPYSWSFTTGDSTDSTPPQPLSFTPPDNATGVSTQPTLSITFNEPVVAEEILAFYHVLSGNSNNHRPPVRYSTSADGKTLYIQPQEPLAPNHKYLVAPPRTPDLSLNYYLGYPNLAWSFTTAPPQASSVTTQPFVTHMSPSPDATGVPFASPVLTFSEPLSTGTVNPSSFAVFSGGKRLQVETYRSSDGTTVTLDVHGGLLQPDEPVTVYASSGATNFAGVPLAPFIGSFETQPEPLEPEAPRFLGILPESGATQVAPDNPITLFFSQPIDASTVNVSLQLAVDGVLVPYAFTQQANGQVVKLQPSESFPPGAFVELFAATTLLGSNRLQAFPYPASWSFTSVPAPMSEPTRLVALSPSSHALPRPANSAFSLRFNNPLDPSAVTASTLQVLQAGSTVPGVLSFSHQSRVVTFRPNAPLATGPDLVVLATTDIRDADGARVFPYNQYLFNAALPDPPDTTPPSVERLTPPAGADAVPVNSQIEIVFDELLDTAAIAEGDIVVTAADGEAVQCSLTLSPFSVRLSPNAALRDSTIYTVVWNGARDLAGNLADPVQFAFTTGASIDLTPP